MRLIWLRWFVDRKRQAGIAAVLLIGALSAATRPHYGGTLRVEMRGSIESADPPTAGHGIPDLAGAFTISRWEAGRRAVYEANENAPGGRPFLDSIEIQMGRPLRDQSIDLELGKADIVELGPSELLRQPAGRRSWTSGPVRLLALVFGNHIDNARIREALALAVDRSAIHAVLLQRQGEISGALLPQWISGYAFLFPVAADAARARTLLASLPVSARTLSLGVNDAAWRPIAERIALNARYAGLTVTVVQQGAQQNASQKADVRLVEVRVGSTDPARALAGMAASLGLPGTGAQRFTRDFVGGRARAAGRFPRGPFDPPAGCLWREPARKRRARHHAAGRMAF